ncbi:MAG: hypothetical protein P8Y58_11130 [Novosphingobium sp.]
MKKPTAPKTDADDYGRFMTALLGLLDDAELSGYSAAGIDALREAADMFFAELTERHPNVWK